MPDKWDSADGQTHDESELIATDEYLTVVSRRLGHVDWWRDATIEQPTASDDDLTVQIVNWALGAIEPATKTPAQVAILIRDSIAARVAEAVRPYAELRDQVVRYYDGLPADVEVPEFVATARRLMEEADRG